MSSKLLRWESVPHVCGLCFNLVELVSTVSMMFIDLAVLPRNKSQEAMVCQPTCPQLPLTVPSAMMC